MKLDPKDIEHLFIEPGAINDGRFSVEGEGLFHLSKVKRVRRGEEFTWSDGSGTVGKAVLEEIDGGRAIFLVLETKEVRPRAPSLRLYQALPRGGRMEEAMRRCTEVGVDHFVPFVSSRSVRGIGDGRDEQRRRRWERVLREAARQSRREFLPTVETPLSWDQCLGSLRQEGVVLLGWEGERRRRLLDSLPKRVPPSVALVVGPEGGFSRSEVDQMCEAGALPVTLGGNVLRTENAGLVMAVLVSGFYGII